MKRVFLSLPFLFQIIALLYDPAELIAAIKPESFLKRQDTKTGFIENKGQIIDQNNKPNPAVLYLLNNPGFNVQLRRGGFSYDLYQADTHDNQRIAISYSPFAFFNEDKTNSEQRTANSYLFHRIDITLEGANPECQIIPSDPLPDYSNYFTASAPPEGI